MYKVTLPGLVRLHLVFNVSLLDLKPSNPWLGQRMAPPPRIMNKDDEEYEIEEIFHSKLVHNRPCYYIQCTGYKD